MEKKLSTNIVDTEYPDQTTKRTILDLIDAESGEMFNADTLDTMTEAELARLKELQSLAKKSGKYKYVCSICGQPVRLDVRQFASKRYKSYFFSHYSNGDDCPLKTSNDALDPVQSTINWYGKFKESKFHKEICRALMTVLEKDARFSKIESNPTISIYGEDVLWQKPDVTASFYGYQLVFESLMYNTFLSSIIDKNSFYRKADAFLLWIFPHFSVDDQTMCEKDVYYSHRRNIFVFDSKDYYQDGTDLNSTKPRRPVFSDGEYLYAQEESLKRGQLLLNCYWQTPIVEGGNVKIQWHHKLVGIEELTFDALKRDVFFHNCDYDFKEVSDPVIRNLIDNWEQAKEARWDKFFQGIRERKEKITAAEAKKKEREKERDILSRVHAGELVPEPFEVNGKHGYKYEDTIVIKPRYYYAFPFRNGFAIVGNKKKRGLINTRNEFIFEMIYDILYWVSYDRHKLLLMGETKNGQYYICDPNGNRLVDFPVSSARGTEDNIIFKTPDGKYGVMSYNGRILIDPIYDEIKVNTYGSTVYKYGKKSKTVNNKEVVKPKVIKEIAPGLFIAERIFMFGVVNSDGDTVVPFVYTHIADQFEGEYLRVKRTQGHFTLHGVLNRNLELVLPMDSSPVEVLPNGNLIQGGTLFSSDGSALLEGYKDIEQYPDGSYILTKTEYSYRFTFTRYGLADKEGKIVFPCMASVNTKDDNGNAGFKILKLKNGNIIKSCFGEYALFNPEGDALTSKTYDSIKELPNGNFLVSKYGSQGIIDSNGKEILECRYEKLKLTKSGDIIITTNELDEFCNKVHKLDRYALSDKSGNLLTDFLYDTLDSVKRGVYIAGKWNGFCLLNKSGEVIYSSDNIIKEYKVLDTGFILIKNSGRCGVLDSKGSILVPMEYNSIEQLPSGYWKVMVENYDEKFYGLLNPDGSIFQKCVHKSLPLDKNGNLQVEFKPLVEGFQTAKLFYKYALANSDNELRTDYLYDSIESIGNNRFAVRNGSHIGLISGEGSIIVPTNFSEIAPLPRGKWLVKRGYFANVYHGIYNDNGEELYPCQYMELETDDKGDVIPTFSPLEGSSMMKARMLDKYALCDSSHSLLTGYDYDDITSAEENMFVVTQGTYQGIVDSSGKEVLHMSEFQILHVVDEEHFISQDGQFQSLITNDGSVLSKQKYSEILPMKNGSFIGLYDSWNNGYYKQLSDYFDSKGEVLATFREHIPLDEEKNPVFDTIHVFSNYKVYKCGGKYAISSTDSISLLDFKYYSVKQLGSKLLIIGTSSGYGLLGKNGVIVLPPIYEKDFEMYALGIIKFHKKRLYGLCDESGKILAEPSYKFIRENKPGHFKLFFTEGSENKSKFLDIEEKEPFIVGNTYTGTVSGVKDYGIFVHVEGNGSGLIHISQLEKTGKSIKAFSMGDSVNVKILRIRQDNKVEMSLQ